MYTCKISTTHYQKGLWRFSYTIVNCVYISIQNRIPWYTLFTIVYKITNRNQLNMTTISTRLTPKEMDYLTKIAIENKIFKADSKDVSHGKAMKELVKWCQSNNVDINKQQRSMDDDIKKMIEQIHISIPNLLYLTRLQLLLNSASIPDEELSKFVKKTIDYLNSACGDFQNINYNEVRFSMNDLGIKQTPIDKDKSLWKSR